MTDNDKLAEISIHAPVKGATASPMEHTAAPGDFNPRSREGSDSCCRGCHPRPSDFNPRSREGSDQFQSRHLRFGANFNPRSREGSDHM